MQLTIEQNAVVYSNEKDVLCLAGAGTGKTTCLINKIFYDIKYRHVDSESALCLTFTNAAANEMYVRFKQMDSEIKPPIFSTFHAFCYRILCNDLSVRRKLGYSAIPNIADDTKQDEIKAKALFISGVKLSKKELESDPNLLTEKERFDYNIYKKIEMKLIKSENLITFDQLCYGICKLFEDNDQSIEKYHRKYTNIYVDEFQDTDPAQWRFVKSFILSNIFVVGDSLQSLYSFRGADSSIIKHLASDVNWKTYKLTENHRSTKQICDYANSIGTDDEYRVFITSEKCGEHVDVHTTDLPYSVNFDCVNDIKELIHYSGTKAVLCRTNNEADTIIDILQNSGIPCIKINSNHGIKDYIYSSIDTEYKFNFLVSKLNSGDYIDFVKNCYMKELDTTEDKLSYLLEAYSNEQIREDNDLINTLESSYKNMESFSEYVDCISKEFNLDVNFKYEENEENLIEKFIKSLYMMYEKFIQVGTIHASKGLEYDTVVVTGVGGKSFPLTNEENVNCYYVAVTRAKKKLMVYKIER